MKMQNFFKKQAMTTVALAIAAGSYTLLSFSPSKKVDDPIRFEYKAPIGDLDPYSEQNVQDLDNWVRLFFGSCSSPGSVAACTIDVPLESTIDGDGIELDPDMVELQTSTFSSGLYRVDLPTIGNAKGYSNPINRTTP